MRTNRETLLAKLNLLRAGLAKREILEQSTCIGFQDGYAFTFNEECYCRVPTGLDAQGAVSAKPLLTLLDKYPDDELDVSTTESQFLIKGGRDKSHLRLDVEIAMDLSTVDVPSKWAPLPEDFEEAVQLIADCAHTDVELELNNVHLHPDYMEACDRVQLGRYRLKLPFKKPLLVRSSNLRQVVSLGVNEASVTDSWLHFRNPDGLIVSCRRYLAEYKDLSGSLKPVGENVVLPAGLEDAVARAEIFSKENIDGNQVKLELKTGKCRISSEGINGGHQAVRNVKYTGPDIAFRTSPALLLELAKKAKECKITGERIYVNGGKWQWVSAVFPEGKDQAEGEPEHDR